MLCLCFFFTFSFFLLSALIYQFSPRNLRNYTEPINTKFSGLVETWEGLLTVQFLCDHFKVVAMTTNFVVKFGTLAFRNELLDRNYDCKLLNGKDSSSFFNV